MADEGRQPSSEAKAGATRPSTHNAGESPCTRCGCDVFACAAEIERLTRIREQLEREADEEAAKLNAVSAENVRLREAIKSVCDVAYDTLKVETLRIFFRDCLEEESRNAGGEPA